MKQRVGIIFMAMLLLFSVSGCSNGNRSSTENSSTFQESIVRETRNNYESDFESISTSTVTESDPQALSHDEKIVSESPIFSDDQQLESESPVFSDDQQLESESPVSSDDQQLESESPVSSDDQQLESELQVSSDDQQIESESESQIISDNKKIVAYGICKENTIVTDEHGNQFELYLNQRVAIVSNTNEMNILWYDGIATLSDPEKILLFDDSYQPDFTSGQWAGVISSI